MAAERVVRIRKCLYIRSNQRTREYRTIDALSGRARELHDLVKNCYEK